MSFNILTDVVGRRLTYNQLAIIILNKKKEVVMNTIKINECFVKKILNYINGKLNLSLSDKQKYDDIILEIVNLEDTLFYPLHIYHITHDVQIIKEEEAKDYLEDKVADEIPIQDLQLPTNDVVLGLEVNCYDVFSSNTTLIETNVSYYISNIFNISLEVAKKLKEVGLDTDIYIYRVQDKCRCCNI